MNRTIATMVTGLGMYLWQSGASTTCAQDAAELNNQEYLLRLTTAANGRGCVVKTVAVTSPCRQMTSPSGLAGGIDPGDVIVAINGFRTIDQASLLRAINTSYDGTMRLTLVNRNNNRIEQWNVSAAGNPHFVGNQRLKTCQSQINKIMVKKGLHPSIVPNIAFDADTFNVAVFDLLWNNVRDDISAILKAELQLDELPRLEYAILKLPGTEKRLFAFGRQLNQKVKSALARTFGLSDDNFASWYFVAKTERFVTEQFKMRYRRNDSLDLSLVADGIRSQFDSPPSVVRRTRITMAYTSNATQAYAISPWNAAMIGDADQGISNYYWRLHSGVIQVPDQPNRWSLGSLIVIGTLPKGESDPERIVQLKLADSNTELARRLRITISDRESTTNDRVVMMRMQHQNESREFDDEFTSKGGGLSLLDFGQDVFQELKATLIGE